MKTKLQVGAEIEFITEAELRKVMQDHARSLADVIRRVPIGRWLRNSADPSGGVAVVDLGSPPNGFEWEVRRYFVTGQDPTTIIAGSSCVVFVSADSGTTTPLEAVDTTATSSVTTVPNKGGWTDDQVIVEFGRRLLFRFAGMGTSRAFASAYVLQRKSTQERTPELVEAVPNGGQSVR